MYFLGFILFMLSFNISALASSQCQHQIQVIGWSHNVRSDQMAAEISLNEIMESAQKLDCAKAQHILKDYLVEAYSRVREAKRVIALLQQQKNINAIGLEYSPKEWASLFDKSWNYITDENIKTSLEFCPLLKKGLTELSLAVDPAYYYAKQAHLVLLPLENEKIKAAATRNIAEESLSFDPAREKLTPAARQLIEKAAQKNKNGHTLTQLEVDAIVAAEKDPAQKQRLERIFTQIALALSFNEKRNASMAENAIKENKDLVVLVGQAHVVGLTAQLNRQLNELCLNQK
jgi:hypothetical protein